VIRPVPRLGRRDISHWFSSESTQLKLPAGYSSYRWHSSGAAALAAICAWTAAQKGRPVTVLIPGYFCSQSLRYLRALPVRMVFYALTEKLTLDYEEIRRQMNDEAIDLFVHVHYFGRIAGQQQSRAFADELGAVLIEDCAHVISPLIEREWVGDYLVFAPHKHFPLPKVGLAISRLPFDEQSSKPDRGYFAGWLLRQGLRHLISAAPTTVWCQQWMDTASDYENVSPPKRVTRATVSYLTNSESAGTSRRMNAGYLLAKLESIPGWSRLFSADETSIPYLVGMLCDTPALAEHRFGILNRRACLVMQWPDLPLELASTPRIEAQCADWLDRTLFFFVHQQLDLACWMAEIDNAIQSEKF